MCCEKMTMTGWRNVWSMKLRVQDQGEDQSMSSACSWQHRLWGTLPISDIPVHSPVYSSGFSYSAFRLLISDSCSTYDTSQVCQLFNFINRGGCHLHASLCMLFVFIFISFVLPFLILSPTDDATAFKDWVFSCMWLEEWDSGAKLSANSRSCRHFSEIQWIPVPLLSTLCLVTQSMTIRNSKGDSMHPCLVPDLTSNASVSPPTRFNVKCLC